MKEFTKHEMLEIIEKYGIQTRTQLIAFIIGYNDILTANQWDIISELWVDDFLNE